ncbi:MAG: hypothetical protein QXF15_01600 [Candidatus Aenigmatarchaeota archaeon]
MKGINTTLLVIFGAVIILAIAIAWPAIIKAANLESVLITLKLNCGLEGKECCSGFYCFGGLSCIDGKCYEPKISVDFDDDLLIYNETAFNEYSNEWLLETTGSWRSDIKQNLNNIEKLKEECYGDFSDCSECEYFYGFQNKTISILNNQPIEYYFPCECYNCEGCIGTNCDRCLDCNKYGYFNLPKGIQCKSRLDVFYAENLSFCYKCEGCDPGAEPFSDSCKRCEFCESGETKSYDVFDSGKGISCKFCGNWNGTTGESCYNCKRHEAFLDNYRCKYCRKAENLDCSKNTNFAFCEYWKNGFVEAAETGESVPIITDIPITPEKKDEFENLIINIARTCNKDRSVYKNLDYGMKQYFGEIPYISPYEEDRPIVFTDEDGYTSYWDCGKKNFENWISNEIVFGHYDFGATNYYYSVYTTYHGNLFICRQPVFANSANDNILEITRKLRELDFTNNSTLPGNITVYLTGIYIDWADKYNKTFIVGLINFTSSYLLDLNNHNHEKNDLSNAVMTGIQQWNVLNENFKPEAEKLCKLINESIPDDLKNFRDYIIPENCNYINIIDKRLDIPDTSYSFTSNWYHYWNTQSISFCLNVIKNKTIINTYEWRGAYDENNFNVFIKPAFLYVLIFNKDCPNEYDECKDVVEDYKKQCNDYYYEKCKEIEIKLIPIISVLNPHDEKAVPCQPV